MNQTIQGDIERNRGVKKTYMDEQAYLYFISAALQGTAAIMAVVAAIYVFASQRLQEAKRIVKWHELIFYREICNKNDILKKYVLPEIDALLNVPITTKILNKIREKIIQNQVFKENKTLQQTFEKEDIDRENYKICERNQKENQKWVWRSIIINSLFLIVTAICLGFKGNLENYQLQLIFFITFFFSIVLVITIYTVYLLMRYPLNSS
ncbi:MAG: hypothetical protein HYW47_00900 [Deltaproteobacteria bacterium]|nr:hypothetical protein [Deltaproteobacteria bacterium]